MPEFFADRQRVTVTFRAARYVAPARIDHDLNPVQQMILQALSNAKPSTLAQLSEILGQVRRRTLQDNLQMLRAFGLVELHEGPASFRWMLSPVHGV